MPMEAASGESLQDSAHTQQQYRRSAAPSAAAPGILFQDGQLIARHQGFFGGRQL